MIEKRALQCAMALACAVPLSAGAAGAFYGLQFLDGDGGADLDSHFRYLSALLLGIGLAFLISIPHVECHTARIRTLTAIVFIGGLARLYGMLFVMVPGPGMYFGLAMELIVTPLLCVWQARVAKRISG